MARAAFLWALAGLRAIGTPMLKGWRAARDLRLGVPVRDSERYCAAIAALPRETRTIFLLHRAEGLDIVEIAERTGHSTAMVEQHIAQAILALWAALDADGR